MNVLTDCQQGSPSWHAARTQHFCASEAAAAMGVSKYVTRTQLLNQKATGIVEAVSAAKQRLFDAGHEAESKARSIAERIAGVDFYPVVGTLEVDGLKLLASFDGIDVLDEIVWETKLLNADLVRQVQYNDLEAHYWAQLEHQLLVSGAARALFTTSDGTEEGTHHCFYESRPERRAALIAGWKQFAADVASYQPEAPATPAPTGKAPEALPALHIVLKGEVSASNLATFKEVALAAIRSVNRDLQTDQDFADSAKARKWCEDIEGKVAAAKEHALSQTASIDELFRTMDEISAEARRVRLELDKLEKARTVAINGEIVADGVQQFADHMRALNAAMPSPYMPSIPVDFGGAIKGLRSVASKKDAVATELARAKIAANEIATRIGANIKHLQEHANAHKFLFVDTAAIVLKASDDLQALVANRINAHEQAEQRRLEAQRERIRAEEAAKLQREADEKRRAEEADAQRERIRAEEAAKLQREADEKRRAEEADAQRAAQAAIAVAATPAPAPAPMARLTAIPEVDVQITTTAPARVSPAVPTDSGARLTLGQINERIAPLSITVAGLSELGFDPVEQVKASRLYRESNFQSICAAIVRHVNSVAA